MNNEPLPERTARLVERDLPHLRDMLTKRLRNVTQTNAPFALIVFSGAKFHLATTAQRVLLIRELRHIADEMERQK